MIRRKIWERNHSLTCSWKRKRGNTNNKEEEEEEDNEEGEMIFHFMI